MRHIKHSTPLSVRALLPPPTPTSFEAIGYPDCWCVTLLFRDRGSYLPRSPCRFVDCNWTPPSTPLYLLWVSPPSPNKYVYVIRACICFLFTDSIPDSNSSFTAFCSASFSTARYASAPFQLDGFLSSKSSSIESAISLHIRRRDAQNSSLNRSCFEYTFVKSKTSNPLIFFSFFFFQGESAPSILLLFKTAVIGSFTHGARFVETLANTRRLDLSFRMRKIWRLLVRFPLDS